MPNQAGPDIAVLAGATGLVGASCLRELLASPRFQHVVILVRRRVDFEHPKLEQIVTEFRGRVGLPAMAGGVFLCALGTTIRKAGSQEAFRRVDCEIPFALAREALLCGARGVAVVSSVGANADSGTFYLKVKGEMEEGIRGLGFPSVDIFRPSFLMGNRQEARPGERAGIAVAKALQGLFVGGLSKYRPIAAADVARAVVKAAGEAKPGERVWHWAEMQKALEVK